MEVGCQAASWKRLVFSLTWRTELTERGDAIGVFLSCLIWTFVKLLLQQTVQSCSQHDRLVKRSLYSTKRYRWNPRRTLSTLNCRGNAVPRWGTHHSKSPVLDKEVRDQDIRRSSRSAEQRGQEERAESGLHIKRTAELLKNHFRLWPLRTETWCCPCMGHFLQCTPIRSASCARDPEKREQSWENE